MNDILVERQWSEPLDDAAFWSIAGEAGGCLQRHRVDWTGSLLSSDGKDLLCHFRAPDAESVRIALRQAGSVPGHTWPATIHDAPGVTEADIGRANVAVTRSFEAPVAFEDLQAIEDAGKGCLDTHRVRFVRSYFSTDRMRMVCLYVAPDAESVRVAQREAKMPVDRVFAFSRFGPDMA